jgi:hypothetical protein
MDPGLLLRLEANDPAVCGVDLSGMHVEEDYGIALADALASNREVGWLRLDHASLTDATVVALGRMLQTNTRLKTIFLFGNSAVSGIGWSALRAGLRRNTTLLRLDLSEYGRDMDMIRWQATAMALKNRSRPELSRAVLAMCLTVNRRPDFSGIIWPSQLWYLLLTSAVEARFAQ